VSLGAASACGHDVGQQRAAFVTRSARHFLTSDGRSSCRCSYQAMRGANS